VTDQTATQPAAWVDGDPLMEAIAAAVWEHCCTEGTSLVVDDPRNIAAVAAAVARAQQPAELSRAQAEAYQYRTALQGAARRAALPAVQVPATDRAALRDRIAEALADEDARTCGWGHAFLDRYGADAETDGFVDAVLAVLPAPTDRAAVYAEVADCLAADAEQGEKEGFTRIYRRSAAKQVREWGEELRRMADEAQPERCDVEFEGGGQCTKQAGHRTPQNQDPHTPPAAGARQDGARS
jgi:hypothetical protein